MIASLRNICTAQRQFREAGRGEGGGGTFAELTGAAGVRGGAPLETPLLSRAFRPTDDGSVRRGGYHYRLDRKADGRWCCYAWPVEAEDSWRRTFYIDAGEEIRATRGYAGRRAPASDAVTADEIVWTAAG